MACSVRPPWLPCARFVDAMVNANPCSHVNTFIQHGMQGEGDLRVCFGACSDEDLSEAMTRLSAFINKLA